VERLLPELCEQASAAGADYAEARWHALRSERLRVRAGAIDLALHERSAGVGVRVLVDGAWGFAACPSGGNNSKSDESDGSADGDGERARAAVRAAIEAGRAAARSACERIRLAEEPPQRGRYRTPIEEDPFGVPAERKLADLEGPVATLMADRRRRIRDASAQLYFRRADTHLVTSEGTDVAQTLYASACGLHVVANAAGQLQSRSYPLGHDGVCAARGYELVGAARLASAAERVREEAIALCSSPPLPMGRATIILGSEQLALQVHESCGHPCESDRALGEEQSLAGTSFLAPERLGRFRYGSVHVNLAADARVAGGLGTFGWDDEGVPARRTPLVARGQLVGYLSSRETAWRLGLGRSAGCMRAESFARPPIIRMTNISLEPDPDGPTLAELVADTPHGVLFSCNKSWSIDDRRLNFQFGCEAAWEIVRGRLGRLYRNPYYTGTTPRFWAGCDAVSGPRDAAMWGFLDCGKGDPLQWIGTGHGSAPARFRDVEVGSR
jgi:TldD protein